jgi:aspartate-semialdehyde dehydrogenase
MTVPSIAIVGSESLLGKEIRDVLRQQTQPYKVQLIGADEEETGRITEEDGEPVVITGLDQTRLTTADAVVLAGSAESSHRVWDMLAGFRDKPVIDAAQTLEDIPSSRLAAPLLRPSEPGNPTIIAHPAAVSLAMFFSRIEDFSVRKSLVEIFEPASERGRAGIDELHKQTLKLFAFQGLPKEVFDAQLAYNMLARYGPDAPSNLEQIEGSIERHLVSLLNRGVGARTVPMPSLRLIQAPVFHGYSFSIWVELETAISKEGLATALFSEEDPPDNVAVAGESGIAVGGIRADRNHPKAFWIWMAADNLRLTAVNAASMLEQVCSV